MRTKELFAFIRERHSIYERRTAGLPKPWTTDKILQSYRFCNVYRELDTVTVWIRKNWRDPNATNPYIWFAMAVARLLNKPESLEALDVKKHILTWDKRSFKRIMRIRKEAGEKVFSSAYMIHADAKPGWLKTDYLAERVLTPMWKEREDLRPRKGDTLSQFHSRFMTQRDMGSFMAGQVVADTKFVEPLKSAEDWWSWAAPGPGSQRGLNRVLERPVNAPWRTDEWLRQLNLLQTKIDPLCKAAEIPRISAQDLQNCLCEADKWWRVKNGEGRPKQRYNGI